MVKLRSHIEWILLIFPWCCLSSYPIQINEILEMLGMVDTKDTFSLKLSGGQQKRLSIALELVDDPRIIFLVSFKSLLNLHWLIIKLDDFVFSQRMNPAVALTRHLRHNAFNCWKNLQKMVEQLFAPFISPRLLCLNSSTLCTVSPTANAFTRVRLKV